MIEPAFTDKEHVPTESDLAATLGEVFHAWNRVREVARERAGETVEEWKCYGKKYGWQLKTLLKKRNLFFLIPRTGCFSIVFVFGDRAVEKILESPLSQDLKDALAGARKYSEGRGLSLDVRDNSRLEDIGILMEMKITA